jgi:WD40 repeat protein
LLASGSNDFNVIIVDFAYIISEVEAKKLSSDSKFFSKFVHKFIGHKERITGLSWSTNNLLASCSFDSTVQIWNTDSGKPLANYRGHSEKLLCCLFSNSDSNIVYSGGEDYCLHKWKIDAQSEIMPPEEC